MLQAGQAAQARDMQMVGTIEFNPSQGGTTKVNVLSPEMRLIWAASQARGNIDAVVFAWAKMVQEENRDHGSIILKQIGIEPLASDRVNDKP